MNNETNEIALRDLEVPAANLIGDEGRGFRYIIDGWNAERILIAAECVGHGRFLVERAAAYVTTREVFGKPLGANQSIQFPIARAHAALEAADLVRKDAADRFDRGEPCGPQANMAKLLASEASWQAANAAIDALGGNGFAADFDVERIARRDAPLHRRAALEQPDPRVPRHQGARDAAVDVTRVITARAPLGALPWIAAAAAFAFHLIANPHYGFFRDELYFIACGFRPDWGYVDQPPLVPLMAAATQLGGHSLPLLRAVPALFAGAAVFVSVALAAELGGGAFARVATAIIVTLAPVLAAFGGKVGTDEANPFLWTLAAYALLRTVRADGVEPAGRRWGLCAGVALGLSLETKYSGVFFVAALAAGLLLTRERRALVSPPLLLCAAVTVVLALSSGLWQFAHGLPMLELLRNGQHGKNVAVSPLAYIGQELLIVGPAYAPVWIAGVVRLWHERTTRFLAIAFVVLIAEMILLHGKHYYPAAIYPIPIAAGCVVLDSGLARLRAAALARAVVAFALLAAGAAFIPLVLPVLSERDFLRTRRASPARCTSRGVPPRPSITRRARCRRISPTCTGGPSSRRPSKASSHACIRASASARSSSRATTAKRPPSRSSVTTCRRS